MRLWWYPLFMLSILNLICLTIVFLSLISTLRSRHSYYWRCRVYIATWNHRFLLSTLKVDGQPRLTDRSGALTKRTGFCINSLQSGQTDSNDDTCTTRQNRGISPLSGAWHCNAGSVRLYDKTIRFAIFIYVSLLLWSPEILSIYWVTGPLLLTIKTSSGWPTSRQQPVHRTRSFAVVTYRWQSGQ